MNPFASSHVNLHRYLFTLSVWATHALFRPRQLAIGQQAAANRGQDAGLQLGWFSNPSKLSYINFQYVYVKEGERI